MRTTKKTCSVPCEVEAETKWSEVGGIKISWDLVAAKSSGKEEAIANEDIAETKSGSEEDH